MFIDSINIFSYSDDINVTETINKQNVSNGRRKDSHGGEHYGN